MIERKSKLEAARRLRGWSLEVASQKIGVHPQTLRRWETGKSRPHGFRIYKISEVYETTPAALGIGQVYQPFSPLEDADQTLPDIFLAENAEATISIEDLDLQLLGLILQRKRDRENLDYHTLQVQLHQRIKAYDEYILTHPVVETEGHTRTRALHIVAAVPIAAYLEHIHQQQLPFPPEDILTHCAGAITACWHMNQQENWLLVRSLVSGYLFLLSEIFARFAHCQQASAGLIAQTCMLRTMLALQMENAHAGISFYTRALEFSQLAEPGAFELPLRSLATRNTLHRFGRQPSQALERIAESVWLVKPVPVPPDFSLIRNYVRKLAERYQVSLLHELDTTPLRLSKGSLEMVVSIPEVESRADTLDYAATALHLWDGLTYHELRSYAHTLDDLGSVQDSEAVSDGPEEIRLEFLANRALAALRLHDMDYAITTLRAAIPQALSMGTEQELVETRAAYHLMQFLLASEAVQPAMTLKDLLKTHD